MNEFNSVYIKEGKPEEKQKHALFFWKALNYFLVGKKYHSEGIWSNIGAYPGFLSQFPALHSSLHRHFSFLNFSLRLMVLNAKASEVTLS